MLNGLLNTVAQAALQAMIEVVAALLPLPFQLIRSTRLLVKATPVAVIAGLLLLIGLGLTHGRLSGQEFLTVNGIGVVAVLAALLDVGSTVKMPVLAGFAAIDTVFVGVSNAAEGSIEITLWNASQNHLLATVSAGQAKANSELVIKRLASGVLLRPDALAGDALFGSNKPWL